MQANVRSIAAREAYRKARRWATIVMGISFPFVLLEMCWLPLTNDRGNLTFAVLTSILICGGCWGIWVGSASLTGWCRGN